MLEVITGRRSRILAAGWICVFFIAIFGCATAKAAHDGHSPDPPDAVDFKVIDAELCEVVPANVR